MFDLIVVGASAIGLYLAKEFSKKGNSVLVLERKKEIGKKPCSGLVSEHLFDFVSQNSLFIEKEFSQSRIWIENSLFDFKGRAWLLNREKFDQFLFKEAKESRAEIKLEREVIKIEEKDNFVEVLSRDGESFRGKILAGCDGVISIVAKGAKLPKQRKFLLGVITHIQNSKLKAQNSKHNFPELFFLKEFPGFFAWKIPRKNVIEWGTALNPRYKPKERLKRWLKTNFQLPISSHQFKSALIPLSPLKKTTTRRIFLCGDAAGQSKPYTGGGLVYGLACAKIAAEVIGPRESDLPPHQNFGGRGLEIYEREWRKALIKEIQFGNFIRKCYSLPNFIKKAGLYFLKNRQNLDQDKPSTIF